MSELNPELTPTSAIDTNAEYILPAEEKKQPPVLLSVSKAIIVETIKDFFGSIIGFFWRYIKHFARCIVYFFNPSLQKKPFDKLDFKENSQHAFEFVIIVLAVLIFMIKVGWIPPSDPDLKEIYSDDLVSKVLDFFLFLVFAFAYLLLAAIGIILGRLFRKMFRIDVSVHESDILYIYLNNAFFSIAAIITFVIRSVASTEEYDSDSIGNVIFMIVLPCILIPLLLWSGRFAALHRLKLGKGILFYLLSIVLLSIFYTISISLVCALAVGL